MFRDIVRHAAQAGADRVFGILDNAFDDPARCMVGSVTTLQLMLTSCLKSLVMMEALKQDTAHEAVDALHEYLDQLINEETKK
jgi:hypothetical protein